MSSMSSEGARSWRFITNHTHVLLCIARNQDVRMRDLAVQVGLTERGANRIVGELIDAGFVNRERRGRRNRYVINREVLMQHPTADDQEIGALLDLLRLDELAEPPA